jgi:hypothetical protein
LPDNGGHSNIFLSRARLKFELDPRGIGSAFHRASTEIEKSGVLKLALLILIHLPTNESLLTQSYKKPDLTFDINSHY